MRTRPITLASLGVLLLLPVTVLQAQTSVDARPVHYRLSPSSSFEEGCFAPCLCPGLFIDGLLGTFRMTPAAPDPLFQVFDITEVNWLVPVVNYRVTGMGTYRIGGEFARMHQLQLDLKVADREVQHYDSGLILGGAEFPAIVLSVAMNNMICRDTVFHVQAKPSLPIEAVRFGLHGSTYEEGCFGPCDCLVAAWPLLGHFGLVKLNETNQGTDYAVLDIDWRVRRSSTSPLTDATSVTGYGLYRSSRADGTQRMFLDLIEDGRGPTRFDSGAVPGLGNPRRIDIDVAESAFACFDRVYSIHARRRPGASAHLQGIRPEPVKPTVTPAP